MLFFCVFCFLNGDQPAQSLLDLTDIFREGDRTSFSRLLPRGVRIKTDLRPILYDHGNLDPRQVLLSFEKIIDRFHILEAVITNSQSDTNYSWLEIYLAAVLEDKRTGTVYDVIFAFHFKITASRMAVSRWVLQDID